MAVDKTQKAGYRKFQGITAIVVSAIAVIFSVYHILYISGLLARMRIFIDIPMHLAIHLGLILLLTFLLLPLGEKSSRQKLPGYDVVLGLLGLGWNLYIIINFTGIYMRANVGFLETYEYIGSWINMLVVLEATRRLMGWAMMLTTAFFLVYAVFTNYFPGFLHAPGHDWTRVGRYVGLFITGMYGDVLNISATVVTAFILFGQFLFVTGAGDWFINISQALLGQVRGGSAKIAVAASALMGTITGSGMADVATTGVLTIPMMVKTGYRKHIAGAIQAAAANGAQIMPPVMGIAAFIMVDFLNVPYGRIVLAGIFPALFYYVALFLMADFEAAKGGLRGIPRSELPGIRKSLAQGWPFIATLAGLLILLMGFKYSPELSAMYSTAAVVLLSLFNKKNRLTLDKFLLALKNTAVAMLMLAVVCATAGIIVGSVQLTGLAYRLSMGLLNLSGGNVWLLLLLTAASAIILGFPLNTSAVYLVLAVLVAPALVQMGFTPMSAHFFVFYYGVAAMITPPVCPVSFIAAGIAGAGPMRTGFEATRMAAVTLLVPFIFIFHPALLMEGDVTEVLLTAGYTLLCSIALAAGLVGYMFGSMNYLWRIPFLVGVILIIFPEMTTTFVGCALIIAALIVRFFLSRLPAKAKAVT